jgi:hypothetical protein
MFFEIVLLDEFLFCIGASFGSSGKSSLDLAAGLAHRSPAALVSV